MGTTAGGIFTIAGVTSRTDKSTINLGDYAGFKLDNDTTLNLNNVKINGNEDIITASNSDAEVNLTDAIINGDITAAASTPLNITTSGTSELNGNT